MDTERNTNTSRELLEQANNTPKKIVKTRRQLEMENLKTEISKLQNILESKMCENQEMCTKINELQNLLDNKTSQLNNFESERSFSLETTDEITNEWKDKYESSLQEIQYLQEQTLYLQNNLGNSNSEINNLINENKKYIDVIKNLHNEIDQLKKQVSKKNHELILKDSKIQSTNDKVRIHIHAYESLKKQFDSIQSELIKLKEPLQKINRKEIGIDPLEMPREITLPKPVNPTSRMSKPSQRYR